MKQIKKYYGVIIMGCLAAFFGVFAVLMGESFYGTIMEDMSNPSVSLSAEAGVYLIMGMMYLIVVLDTIFVIYGTFKIYHHVKKWEDLK